jgi:tRNA(Ile)-lysidine synthase
MNIHNSKYVITWHHLDDRIETFFFNMLRGTKLTGLINMRKTPPQSPSLEGEVRGWILRPLLDLEKSEILEYLHWNNLCYFIDETNSDTNFTRNKMRHEILPKLWEIHPNHKKNIWNLLQYFEEIKNNIDSQIDDFLWEWDYFDICLFQARSNMIQAEVIKTLFYRANNNSTIWLSEANISEVIKFINGPNGNTVKEIKEMKLYKKSSKIYF